MDADMDAEVLQSLFDDVGDEHESFPSTSTGQHFGGSRAMSEARAFSGSSASGSMSDDSPVHYVSEPSTKASIQPHRKRARTRDEFAEPAPSTGGSVRGGGEGVGAGGGAAAAAPAPRTSGRTRGRGRKAPAAKSSGKPTHRRLTHNASEQRRVKRISEQVDKLRTVLRHANRQGKSDKCSVLAGTVEYVEELEKEVERIKAQLKAQAASADGSAAVAPGGAIVDYANIFRGGGIAQVVTSPSGEFLDCNEMFSEMSGFKRSEITSYTMFHLTAPSQLPSLYQAVGQLLAGNGPDSMQFTKTCILKSCQVEAYVVMKIVRDDAGAPRYFCCSVMPLRKTPRLPAATPVPLGAPLVGVNPAIMSDALHSITGSMPMCSAGASGAPAMCHLTPVAAPPSAADLSGMFSSASLASADVRTPAGDDFSSSFGSA